MKEGFLKSFKSGVIAGVGFLLTVVIGGLAYAASVTTVTTGDTLTATMWNAMAGNYDYSTTEVDTGKTWIDGKPIYRKVTTLATNTVGNNSWATVTYTSPPSDVDVLVDGKVIASDNTILDGYSTSVTGTYQLQYKIYSTRIGYKLGSVTKDWFTTSTVVILEYTKTTD